MPVTMSSSEGQNARNQISPVVDAPLTSTPLTCPVAPAHYWRAMLTEPAVRLFLGNNRRNAARGDG